MTGNFKYLTHNPDDQKWGIYLTVAGSARVDPQSNYPPSGHPAGYHFNWSKGRVLYEYQLNYITQGEGIFESRDGAIPVREGSVILLKPDEWHRYKPQKETGWTEHYIGFSGPVAETMINASLLGEVSVIHIGFHENVINIFQEIFNHVKSERPGYHQICSGLVIHIMGQIISLKKNEDFNHNQLEKTIQKACLVIRDNLSSNIDIERLAAGLNINYSLFRKAFKNYTGLSPMQYHTSLRMKQAAYLLANTDLSIKEISFNLGFCSVFYFGKLFKEKMNMTPGAFRQRIS
ncbi:MAG TPA: AraC family transcriptional regulator [Bacteroidales bacterium]|nr:AraC family transcriptional regulator [Bacteroidales bacterium]